MYTLSCLQVAYEFLNREWIYLIYGNEKKTCYKTLKTQIGHLYCYILNLFYPKNRNDWCSKDNYKFLIIIIVTSLGILFTTYKVMKILYSPEVKNIMESQWRRNENSNKMSPAFHENNNESAQITDDFPGGTSLTAIVKPTIRNGKKRKNHGNSDNEISSDSDVNGSQSDIINVMNFADNSDDKKPLTKCTSSLRVVTSKDSLNEQLFNKCETEQSNQQNRNNGKEIKKSNQVNNNATFSIQDTSSVFEVDDCMSSMQDSINPYQCSMLASPDTQSIRKNSSYASGHFVENFPELDLSPIPNISSKNNHQSTIEFNDKEITHLKDNEKNCKKHLPNDEQMKNANSTQNVLEKSSDFYFSCYDFKSFLSGKLMSNEKKSKIVKLNGPEASGSKIPIPSKKSSSANVFIKGESNEYFKKSESIRADKNKDDNLRSRESEFSLERFVQLEIATGCCSLSHQPSN